MQTSFIDGGDEMLEVDADTNAAPAKKAASSKKAGPAELGGLGKGKATPPELGGSAKAGGAALGDFNEFDGTFHHTNGARYFPDGNKAAGVNNWLAQADPVPITPATPGSETPACKTPTANTSPISDIDGSVYKDGKRYFPDGCEIKGVNIKLGQKDEEPSLRLTHIPKIRSFA